MSALAAMTSAAQNADAQWDELVDIIWNVLGTAVGSLLAHVGREVRMEWE